MESEVKQELKENRVVAVGDPQCVCKCGRTWPETAFYTDLGVGICCLVAALDVFYAERTQETEEQSSYDRA